MTDGERIPGLEVRREGEHLRNCPVVEGPDRYRRQVDRVGLQQQVLCCVTSFQVDVAARPRPGRGGSMNLLYQRRNHDNWAEGHLEPVQTTMPTPTLADRGGP